MCTVAFHGVVQVVKVLSESLLSMCLGGLPQGSPEVVALKVSGSVLKKPLIAERGASASGVGSSLCV